MTRQQVYKLLLVQKLREIDLLAQEIEQCDEQATDDYRKRSSVIYDWICELEQAK